MGKRHMERYQMIIGHFLPVPLDVRVRERVLLTVLRHPVDLFRVIFISGTIWTKRSVA
jgi:hypothetical protein